MRLWHENFTRQPSEDLSARPTPARRMTMTTSDTKQPRQPSPPTKDKIQKNGGTTTMAQIYTIKKKPTATGQRTQSGKNQLEAALGKRNPLDMGSFSAADLAAIKKAKPGERLAASTKHNLATLVKNELQTPKDGTDFLYLYIYKRLEKTISANMAPPKFDPSILRK